MPGAYVDTDLGDLPGDGLGGEGELGGGLGVGESLVRGERIVELERGQSVTEPRGLLGQGEDAGRKKVGRHRGAGGGSGRHRRRPRSQTPDLGTVSKESTGNRISAKCVARFRNGAAVSEADEAVMGGVPFWRGRADDYGKLDHDMPSWPGGPDALRWHTGGHAAES